MCHFKHFVQSLYYPYSIITNIEEEAAKKPDEFLRQAFYYLNELRDEILQSGLMDEEKLKKAGLRIPEGMDHESAKWPLPKIETMPVSIDGTAAFTSLTFPNADRPGEPYEPFLIEEYAKVVDKNKKKYGVFFGERPTDYKVDALGEKIICGNIVGL